MATLFWQHTVWIVLVGSLHDLILSLAHPLYFSCEEGISRQQTLVP